MGHAPHASRLLHAATAARAAPPVAAGRETRAVVAAAAAGGVPSEVAGGAAAAGKGAAEGSAGVAAEVEALHGAVGAALLQERQLQPAFWHLGRSAVRPSQLLALVPEFAPPSWSPSGDAALLPQCGTLRALLMQPPGGGGGGGGSGGGGGAASPAAVEALLLEAKRPLADCCERLALRLLPPAERAAAAAPLPRDGGGDGSGDGSGGGDGDGGGGDGDGGGGALGGGGAAWQLALLETALLLISLQLGSDHAGRLLALGQVSCVLPQCEPRMHAAGRFAWLARLLVHRGEQERALELWAKLGRGELVESGAAPVEETVALLSGGLRASAPGMRRLPLLPAERVLSYSCWVLLLHPEAGLAIFTSTHQHVPAERCLDHLMGVCGEGSPAVMRYLEWLLTSLKRKPRGGSSRHEGGGTEGGGDGGWGSSDEGDEGGGGWGDEDVGADDEAVDENAPDAKLQGRLRTMLAQLYIKRIEQTAPPAAAAAASPAAATTTSAAHTSKDGEDAAAATVAASAAATAATAATADTADDADDTDADADSKEGAAWRGGTLGDAAADGASRQPMPSLREMSISDNFFSSPVDLDASREASSLDGSGGALSRQSSGVLERQSSAAPGTWAGVFRPSGWGAEAAAAAASAPATLGAGALAPLGSTDAAAAAAAAAAGNGEEAGEVQLKLQRLLHESATYDSCALLRSVRADGLQLRVSRLQPHMFRLQPHVPRL